MCSSSSISSNELVICQIGRSIKDRYKEGWMYGRTDGCILLTFVLMKIYIYNSKVVSFVS